MTIHEIDESASGSAAGEGLGRRGKRYDNLTPEQKHGVLEAARMYQQACTGNLRRMADFQEALGRSDFQYLFGLSLDKSLLAAYEAITPVWPQFATPTTVKDFKTKSLEDLLGGRAILSEVLEGSQYPQDKVSDAEYSIKAKKYGKRIGITWEASMNDDLDALRQLPERQALAARYTEDKLATAAIVSATGPNTTFFAAGNSNLLSGNPVLTQSSLASAITTVTTRRDATDNVPLMMPRLILMVPQSLALAAQNIINTVERRVTVSGTESLISGNGLGADIRLVVNPWLSVIDVSGTTSTTWYILPDPSSARPAVAAAKLRGHETPDLRQQANTGVRVGGGAIDPSEGDFEIDSINYRVRHVFGAAYVDPFATAVSTGAGS